MSNIGIVGQDPNPLYQPFNLDVNSDAFIGPNKLGGLITEQGLVPARALRVKKMAAVALQSTSATTVAHGLVDQEGNAITPLFVVGVAGPGAVFQTQEADATNVYLQATAAGNFDLLLFY